MASPTRAPSRAVALHLATAVCARRLAERFAEDRELAVRVAATAIGAAAGELVVEAERAELDADLGYSPTIRTSVTADGQTLSLVGLNRRAEPVAVAGPVTGRDAAALYGQLEAVLADLVRALVASDLAP